MLYYMSFTCLQLVLFQNKHLRLTSIASIGKLVDGKSSTLSEDFTGCPRTIMGWDRMGDRNDNNNTAHSPRLDIEQVMYTHIGQMIGSLRKVVSFSHCMVQIGLTYTYVHACLHTHTTIHTNLYIQVNMYTLTWSRGMGSTFHISLRSLFNTLFCYRLTPFFRQKSGTIMVLGPRFWTVLELNQGIFFCTNVTWPVLG